MNYLIYPVKVMRITQTQNDGNHASHSSGNIKDYPIDEAGADAGRDNFYCPCDKIRIERIYGVGNSGVNTIWMTSLSPVVMPYGTDIVTIMVEHPEDDDLRKLGVGQIFSRGEVMFREGKDGATGNHLHISVGLGQVLGNGWARNNKGVWVLTTTGGAIPATEAFYLDGQTIRGSGGLTFQNKPKEEEKMDNTPSPYAKEAVEWAIQEKILQGSDGNYMLHESVTREDALVFLYRAMHL